MPYDLPTFTDRNAIALEMEGGTYSPALIIDPQTGRGHIDYTHKDTNTVQMDEYHGRTLRFTLAGPRGTTPDAVSFAHYISSDEATALVARIVAGYSEDWDGSNMRGRLTEDASEAADDLRAALGGDGYGDSDLAAGPGFYDAADWLQDETVEPDETDEQLAGRAAEYEADALADGHILIGTRDALEAKRDDAHED